MSTSLLRKILKDVKTNGNSTMFGNIQRNFLITENPQLSNNSDNNLCKSQKFTLNNSTHSVNTPSKNLLTTNVFICQGKNYNSLKQFKIGSDYKVHNSEKKYYIPIMLKLNEKEILIKKKENLLPDINAPKIPQYLYINHPFNSPKSDSNNNILSSNDIKKINNDNLKNNKINYTNDNDYLDKIVHRKKIFRDQMIHRYKILHGNHGFKYFFNNENNKKNKQNFWQKPLDVKEHKKVDVNDEIKNKIIGYDKIFFNYKNDEDETGDDTFRIKYDNDNPISHKKDSNSYNFNDVKFNLKK